MTSTIKVNTIQNTCGADIIKESSNTITIGASGDTVTLASGASQTGFGRTGTVDWQTSIKTSATFSASNGEGYFVDTSSNAVTANLPAGSVGAIVAFKDYAQNFDTNALTIAANGSDKIEGQTFDLILQTEGHAVTLVFGDSTKGWQAVNSNEIANTQKFIAATGGTVSTVCTNFKVHTFTGPGTFCVSCAGNASGSNTVDYLVIAGGGGGGAGGDAAAGGGAGGYRFSNGTASGCYTTAPGPLAPLGATALPVTASGFPITVGAGGGGSPGTCSPERRGAPGGPSVFSTITSTGGGGGGGGPGGQPPSIVSGRPGGSGGGAASTGGSPGIIGSGNTPPVSPPQGNNGGTGASNNTTYRVGGGGGGAGAVGESKTNPVPSSGTAGAGGGGIGSCITASPVARGGGGGAGKHNNGQGPGPGGAGGGGAGAGPGGANAGTANTGGGGGGGGDPGIASAAGGSGIVIIRYKFQ